MPYEDSLKILPKMSLAVKIEPENSAKENHILTQLQKEDTLG